MPSAFLSMILQNIMATPVLTAVATMAGPTIAAGFTLSVLAPISNDIYRDQLYRRNIDNEEGTHFISCNPFSLAFPSAFPSLLSSSRFPSSSMAFSPKGVAAQPRPRKLAIILADMYSRDRCSFGIWRK